MNKIATVLRDAGQRYSVLSFNWLPLLLLLAAVTPAAQGQTYYVFYNENVGYIYDDGTDIPSVTSDLSKAIVWRASATFGNAGINIRSYTRSDKYLRGGTNGTALSLGTSQANWRLRNSVLNYNNANNNTVKYTTQLVTGSNDGNRFTPKVVTIGTPYNATIAAKYNGSITGGSILVGSGATESYSLAATHTTSYTVSVTEFSFDESVQFRDTTVASVPTPTNVNLNDGWTVTWSLSDETYATINSSTGVLTVKATLPATRATTSVQVHATKDGNAIDAELSVTIYASETVMRQYVVILDDREDHNWTYYQATGPDGDYPPELRSPNPRNVKITYLGGGVANASAVAVSSDPGETHNTFVYYKTIERLAWGNSTGRWLTGEYAYRVIPNPFSKRPRTTPPAPTDRTSGYFGFGGWKIISGGEYIVGHNNGDVLGLEDIINFTGLDAGYTPNCTLAEVVFEATWVTAYVVESITTTGLNGSTYETNFIVVRNNNNNNVQDLGTPATVSSRYPDGNASGYTPTIQNFRTSSAILKLEYIKIGDGITPVHPTTPDVNSSTSIGSGTFTTQASELIVGRGCTGTVTTLNSGDGGGQYKYRIESGKYQYMNSMASAHTHSDANPNYGRIILGCDFDRAADDGIAGNGTGDNTKLRVVNFVSLNGGGASGSGASELLDITVKSGYYGFSANKSLWGGSNASPDGYGLGVGGNTDGVTSYTTIDANGASVTYNGWTGDNGNTWLRTNSFYVGNTRGGGSGGVNRMLVEGGEFSSINGGGNNPGNANTIGFHFRMKGGWVKGAVYGTASVSNTTGSRRLVFTGGEVNGWVAGGCNGTNQDNDEGRRGENSGICYIYAGGTTEFRSHDGLGTYNNAYGLVAGVPGGQIFGAGRGLAVAANESENIKHYGSTTTAYVVMADEAEVEQNVYGGGYNGVSQASHVYVTGGTVGGKVFGGTARAISQHATWRCNTTDLRMYGGTVLGGVYGSHDETGDQYSNVNVQILGGTVGAADQLLGDGSRNHDLGNVFGCGFGVNTSVAGNVVVVVGDSAARTPHVDNPVIWGNVFGGGHEANYTSTGKTFKVLGYNGTVKESVFGGGKGVLNENKGRITGDTYVWLKGSILVESDVYGGGLAGVVTGNTNVKISD